MLLIEVQAGSEPVEHDVEDGTSGPHAWECPTCARTSKVDCPWPYCKGPAATSAARSVALCGCPCAGCCQVPPAHCGGVRCGR